MKQLIIRHTLFLLFLGQGAIAQQKAYDLPALLKNGKLRLYNRTISISNDVSGKAIKVNENTGEGLVWLKDIVFSEGTIEVDLRGKDVFQNSFVGVAFHGVNDSTYDAIYFRPFNFHAKDSIRKIHAVQYISEPEFGWERLRKEHNGVFEKALVNPPDPNGWFHARIIVKGGIVTVYVNDDKTPSLTVNKLNTRTTGTPGLWVGPVSESEFKNVTITSK